MTVPAFLCVGTEIAPSIAQYETEDIIEAVVDLAEEYDIMVRSSYRRSA